MGTALDGVVCVPVQEYVISPPMEGAGIQFDNLVYKVKVRDGCKPKRKEKIILNHVSGVFRAGHLVAVLGPSGSGKTTLLNVLGGRAGNFGGAKLEGRINVGGQTVDPVQWRSRIAYVMQDDALFATSTVRETVAFSARMRLPKAGEHGTVKEEVDALLKALRLTNCADTYIGNSLIRGVSGGERKRCAVGVELVACPNLLLLDEPTSGLDSYAAYLLVERLRAIAHERNIAVIMTIHQPSSEMFVLYDEAYFLRAGEIIYRGRPSAIPAYCASIGKPMPHAHNPADHLLFVAQTADDVVGKRLVQVCPLLNIEGSGRVVHLPHARRRNIFLQLWVLLVREVKHTYRDYTSLIMRMVIALIMHTIVALIFADAFDTKPDVKVTVVNSTTTSPSTAPVSPPVPVAPGSNPTGLSPWWTSIGVPVPTPPTAVRIGSVYGTSSSSRLPSADAATAGGRGRAAISSLAGVAGGSGLFGGGIVPSAPSSAYAAAADATVLLGGTAADRAESTFGFAKDLLDRVRGAWTSDTTTNVTIEAGKESEGDSTAGLSSGYNALIQLAIMAMFGISQATLLSFPLDRPVFLREVNAGTYFSGVYFLSKTIVEIPLVMFQVALGLIIPYFVIGFSANFFFLWGALVMLGLASSSVSLALGCATSSAKQAIELTPLIFVPQLFFSGTFIPITRIPVWLRWIQWIAPLKYAVNLMALAEFPNGSPVLVLNDIVRSRWWFYLMMLFVIIILFRTLGAVLLSIRSRTLS